MLVNGDDMLTLLALDAQGGVEVMKNLQQSEQGKPAVLTFGGEGGRDTPAASAASALAPPHSRCQAMGYVWVNGHLLGLYWNVGPQERLYCPGEFLKHGRNVIEVLDLFMTTENPPTISGKRERNMEVHKHTRSLNNQR